MTNSEIVAPFFKPAEFNLDGVPVIDKMNSAFLLIIVELRRRCGFPFVLNSTWRSAEKNRKVGGAKDSMHLKGRAVDIAVGNGTQRAILLKMALEMGLSVGIMVNAVHVDNREDQTAFHYYDKYIK
jgi:uncharacterized protein YcbK (DUF882 family)